MVSTGTCTAGGRKAGPISISAWRLASILPCRVVPTGRLEGDRLAARCWEWRWNCSRCWAWEGIGVRWGDKKPAGWARGGSRAWEAGAVGWLVSEGRETGSKYWTPPGRDKGETTEEAWWLPTRPASSDPSRLLLFIAAGGREESEGSLVMLDLLRARRDESSGGATRGQGGEDEMYGGRGSRRSHGERAGGCCWNAGDDDAVCTGRGGRRD